MGKLVWTVKAPGVWGVSWLFSAAALLIWAFICRRLWVVRKRKGREIAPDCGTTDSA